VEAVLLLPIVVRQLLLFQQSRLAKSIWLLETLVQLQRARKSVLPIVLPAMAIQDWVMGPAGAASDPAPGNLQTTSGGDDCVYWRISEGGMMEPFNSNIPARKG